MILSLTGVQQGSPLGPVPFALMVNSCARSITSPLNVWYLDDTTIGGPAVNVVAGMKRINLTLPISASSFMLQNVNWSFLMTQTQRSDHTCSRPCSRFYRTSPNRVVLDS